MSELRITFEREDSTYYDYDGSEDQLITLIDGQTVPLGELEIDDEVPSHYSTEHGGRGHRVTQIRIKYLQ